MPTINRSEYLNEVANDLRVNTAIEGISNSISKDLVVTYPLYPLGLKAQLVNGYLNAATSVTVLTTNSNFRYFIHSAHVSIKKDAGNAATVIRLTVVQNGATVSIFQINTTANTAEQIDVTCPFPVPIEVDKGSVINLTSDSAAAVINVRCALTYTAMSR